VRRILPAMLGAAAAAGCNLLLGLDETHLAGDGGTADAPPDGPLCVPSTTADEDGDSIPDDCDVCPHVGDFAQTDGDGDGVGDACDPRPGEPDQIVLFDPLSANPNLEWAAWRGGWSSLTGEWSQLDPNAPLTYSSRRDTELPEDAVVDVGLRMLGTANDANASIGAWLHAVGGGATEEPSGYACLVSQRGDGPATLVFLASAGGLQSLLAEAPLLDRLDAGARYRLRMSRTIAGGVSILQCTVYRGAQSTSVRAEQALVLPAGTVGLRTETATLAAEYVVVFAPRP
jgi:hypothetical protein